MATAEIDVLAHPIDDPAFRRRRRHPDPMLAVLADNTASDVALSESARQTCFGRLS